MTKPVKAPASNRVNGTMPQPKPEVEVGVSAFLPFVVPYKNAWEALRDEEITVRQLDAMRKTDGQARALYRLITLPIRAALKTATFVPETNVDGGEEEAQWIEQMFTLPSSGGGMTVPFSRVIAQMLTAVFDGFSAFEMVYWVPKIGPLKGKWTLKKLAYRPSHTLTFMLDDNSEFAGLRQRTMYQARSIDVIIPGEHAVYYAANEEEKPFYGQSYFLSAFYHWDKKFKLYVVAHIAAQRAAVGTRVGTLPKNPNWQERERFDKALSDLGVAQYMTIPEDYKVESLHEVTNFDFLSYINHHNSQMSKSVLAAFFDEQQGSGGDASLVDFGRQSDALFLLMLQTVMGEIEEVVNNKIIPRFIDWNFASGKYPKFQFGSLSEEQKGILSDLFKTLAVGGQSLTISPEFLHELEKQMAEELGLEIDYEAVEDRMAQEAEIAAQQQDMQMQQDQMQHEQAMNPDPASSGGSGSPPEVDPSILPSGFTLSAAVDGDLVTLTDLAADLLSEAYDEIELTRGKARAGFKRVVSQQGVQIYGQPLGTVIKRDQRQSAQRDRGQEGKNFGGVRGKDRGQSGTGEQVLGGGPGAKAQSLGGVNTAGGGASAKPQQILGHPDAPGAQLLDFGDGTVAIRDGQGNVSPRQRFQIEQFLKLGWKVSHMAGSKDGKDAIKAPTK